MRVTSAFSLLEVLLSLAILSFALLALAQLQISGLDYQYEAVLLTRASLILHDGALASIYQTNSQEADRAQQVRMNFPQGFYENKKTADGLGQSIVWRMPRQLPYHLQFILR